MSEDREQVRHIKCIVWVGEGKLLCIAMALVVEVVAKVYKQKFKIWEVRRDFACAPINPFFNNIKSLIAS